MESRHVGRNGRLDAFTAAWLLENDHVFFLQEQIAWDGERHTITGVQVNTETKDEVPELSENSEEYLRGVIDVMTTLEADGELHVEKEKIHPALYPALHDEDLTGITLFNLQACRQAYTISTPADDADGRQRLKKAGLEWVLQNPGARRNTYVVSVDNVLLKGIPGFPELIKKMILDMRSYNGVEKPCAILVIKHVESEPNQCFGKVDSIVKGSVSKNLCVEFWPAEKEFTEGFPEGDEDETNDSTLWAGNESSMQTVASVDTTGSGELPLNVETNGDISDMPEPQDLSSLEVGEASRARAGIAVRQASEKGVELDYSEDSITALESLLHRLYTSREIRMASDDKIWEIAYIYGSYLGETMLRAGFSDQGFAWAEDYDGEPCLQRDADAPEGVPVVNKMAPITKVYKRLSNGPDESVTNFYETVKTMAGGLSDDGGSNEPDYIGENGKIDPMAVAWLFAHDYIFFNNDEIVWDGVSHKVTGAQLNMAKILEMPKFMADAGTYMTQIGDLLAQLESDRRLVVSRERIHPGLYSAIREGDLTGVTLFNLQACARAFMFLDDENEDIKRQTIEMAGLDSLFDDPDSDKNIFVVSVDLRLLQGIPDFYWLVKRMFEDMRTFSGNEDPFVLAFVSSRNIDADQCLGEVGHTVDGAVSEPFHIELGNGASSGGGQLDEVLNEEPEADETEEVSDRDATIALLRLLVLSNDLGGTNSKYPQDMLDELERAENGDETVDVGDLAARMNAFGPEPATVEVSSVTFDEGKRVTGRRFSMAVPDGWTALENYTESTFMGEQIRPFVIVPGDASVDDDISMSDRVIYSSLAGDTDPAEEMLDFGISDLKWALSFNAAYDRSDDQFGALKPIPLWDDEVQAVNTKCFVMGGASIPGGDILDGPNALQYTITPYALDHMDFLRVSMSYEEGKTDIEELRAFIVKLASTVELDNPIVPACEKSLEKALAGKVSAEEFAEMAEALVKPYFALRQMVFTSFQYRHVAHDGGTEDDELTLAGARGVAEFDSRAVPVFEKLLDAYDRQVDEGASIADLDKMLESLTQFDTLAFPTSEIFDGDDAKLVDENGVFEPSPELQRVRERLEFAKEHGGMRTVSGGAKAVARNTVAFVPKNQEDKPPQRTIEEPYKTKGLERLEKALKERIDARYFIETSEMIAEELMSKRQEACDKATNAMDTDEDNVTAMSREFGRFNDVFCRYFGHLVTIIEAQSDLGTPRSEIERMAAEANEFAELVADRFSCGNEYLDDIANKRAPVKRPGEYDEIRNRWQKLNER